MHSPDGSSGSAALTNYASLNVLDEIRRMPGVGDAQMWGQDYSIRIWMQPDKLAQLGLTAADVTNAVRAAELAVRRRPRRRRADERAGRLHVTPCRRRAASPTPEEFEQIVVHTTEAGAIVRLKDVARVELGAQNYNSAPKLNGQPTVPIAIFLQPGANALQTGGAIQARLDGAEGGLPQGHGVHDPVRHAAVREGLDQGSGQDAARGDGAGVLRRAAVPAELARHAHPDAGGAGVADRHVRRDVAVRLLDQHADAVRHGAGDRHRRRRCDRRAGKRRAHHDDRESAGARGDDEGDGGSHAARHRDRAGADGGVPAGRVPRRTGRRDVPAVRGDDRRLGRDLGLRRADAHAGVVRADAASARRRA